MACIWRHLGGGVYIGYSTVGVVSLFYQTNRKRKK
nr:MAG TPA: hypothetical protein [Caudoviricetes sp.]